MSYPADSEKWNDLEMSDKLDVDNLIRSASSAFSFFIPFYCMEQSIEPEIAASIVGRIVHQADLYFAAIRTTLETANHGCAISDDALILCQLLEEGNGTSAQLKAYLDSMVNIASTAHQQSLSANEQFREIRRGLMKICKDIPGVLAKMKQRERETNIPNREFTPAQDTKSFADALTDLYKMSADLDQLIKHIGSFANWWQLAETRLFGLQSSVDQLTLNGANPLRIVNIRMRWTVVKEQYISYSRKISYVQDMHPQVIQKKPHNVRSFNDTGYSFPSTDNGPSTTSIQDTRRSVSDSRGGTATNKKHELTTFSPPMNHGSNLLNGSKDRVRRQGSRSSIQVNEPSGTDPRGRETDTLPDDKTQALTAFRSPSSAGNSLASSNTLSFTRSNDPVRRQNSRSSIQVNPGTNSRDRGTDTLPDDKAHAPTAFRSPSRADDVLSNGNTVNRIYSKDPVYRQGSRSSIQVTRPSVGDTGDRGTDSHPDKTLGPATLPTNADSNRRQDSRPSIQVNPGTDPGGHKTDTLHSDKPHAPPAFRPPGNADESASFGIPLHRTYSKGPVRHQDSRSSIQVTYPPIEDTGDHGTDALHPDKTRPPTSFRSHSGANNSLSNGNTLNRTYVKDPVRLQGSKASVQIIPDALIDREMDTFLVDKKHAPPSFRAPVISDSGQSNKLNLTNSARSNYNVNVPIGHPSSLIPLEPVSDHQSGVASHLEGLTMSRSPYVKTPTPAVRSTAPNPSMGGPAKKNGAELTDNLLPPVPQKDLTYPEQLKSPASAPRNPTSPPNLSDGKSSAAIKAETSSSCCIIC